MSHSPLLVRPPYLLPWMRPECAAPRSPLQVELSSVFEQVEDAKREMSIRAWGIANTTLEDVFINIARAATPGGEAKLS